MDGYAVTSGEGPWRVVQESAAGGPTPHPLGPAEAARIFTGAPLPQGADAILIQENATRDGDLLSRATNDPLKPGVHIRPRKKDAGIRLARTDRHLDGFPGMKPDPFKKNRFAKRKLGDHFFD
jgi:hypothetical protein